MKKALKVIEYTIYSILGMILILNVVILAKSLLHPNDIPGVFGYKPFVVLSGSMEPNIRIGDLIIIKKTDVSTLEKNDIIAFRGDKNLVTTHRIINVINTGNDVCFETKGDSNNVKDDEIVCSENIEGKYIKRYEKIGSLILFIQEPLGFGMMIMTILLIGIIIFLIKNKKYENGLAVSEEDKKAFEEFKKARDLKK